MWERFLVAIVCSLLLLHGPAWSAQVRDPPLSEKVSASDVVVIGNAMERPRVVRGFNEYIWVHVQTVLKGHPSHEIKVLVISNVGEDSVQCCVAGTRLLLFLQKTDKENEYALFFASHGLYVVR